MSRKKHNPKRTFLLILSLLILNLSAAGGFFTANATVRYVSHSGSNTPPYTSWATAADSIMSAINISVFGDTIYVDNGVYKERIDMIPGLSLFGAGMDSCAIDTRGFPYSSGFYSIKIADSCIISGFHIITYDEDRGFGIYIREEAGMTINSNIVSNKIEKATDGIRFSGFNTTNSETFIYKNWIFDVEDGITCMLNEPLIMDNYIYPNEDGLVSQINSAPTYINNIIVFDIVYGSTGYKDFGSNSILKNNLIYGKGSYGLWTYGDSIVNNVLYGQDGNWNRGIFGAGSDIRNNNVQNANIGLFL